jgi:hypothetical protein
VAAKQDSHLPCLQASLWSVVRTLFVVYFADFAGMGE